MPTVSVPGAQRCCIRQGRASVGGPTRDEEPSRGSHVARQPSGQLCFPLSSSDCGTDFVFFFLKRGPFLKSMLNLLQHCFCFMLWFFGQEACGISAPWPGTEPQPLHWKAKFNPGLPGKSPDGGVDCRQLICRISLHVTCSRHCSFQEPFLVSAACENPLQLVRMVWCSEDVGFRSRRTWLLDFGSVCCINWQKF